MAEKTSDGAGKFIMGICCGAFFTWIGLHTGYKRPAILELPEKIAALPQLVIADTVLEDPASTRDQQQRAIAVLLKHDDELFAKVDAALDYQFTDAMIDEKVQRRAVLARASSGHGVDTLFSSDRYQALREVMERRYGSNDPAVIRRRMVAEKIQDDGLLRKTLQRRFPGESLEQLADRIITSQSAAGQAPLTR